MALLMASPTDRDNMEVCWPFANPRLESDMMCIHSVFSASPTGLLMNPVEVFHGSIIPD